MITEERVFVAGAGPVGLVAAAALVRRGIPVTVFEASPTLSCESRASTFHPSTLDMLDDLGVADALVATGLVAPRLQYRTRRDGVLAVFDFAGIADVTRHPYRLQSEQHNLTRIIDDSARPRSDGSAKRLTFKAKTGPPTTAILGAGDDRCLGGGRP